MVRQGLDAIFNMESVERNLHFELLAFSAQSVLYISLVANNQRNETLDT